MKYIILYLALLFSFNICAKVNAKMKEQLDSPKVIYEQNVDSLTIQLIEFDSKDSIKWQTKLINQKNKNELILNEESKEKGIAWNHYEFVGENPQGLYIIANAYISERDIIIAYYQFGVFLLQQYHFTDSLKFEMKETKLDGGMALPSYGKVTAEAKFLKIGKTVFISACFGQYSSGVRKKLLKLDITNFVTTEIVFDSKPVQFIGVGIGIRAKEYLEYLKDRKEQNLLTPSLEQELLFLTGYTDKPYYFKQVELDQSSDLSEKIYSYVDLNLDLYYFFLTKDGDILSKEKSKLPYATLQDIKKYSSDVLSFHKPELNQQIEILGYICNDYVDDVGNRGADIFIFYQDDSKGVKILQYQNFEPMWILSDFTEQK